MDIHKVSWVVKAELVLSPDEFHNWLFDMKRKLPAIYHEGFLMEDSAKMPCKTAALALEAAENGAVHLVQKRSIDGTRGYYTYIAVKDSCVL